LLADLTALHAGLTWPCRRGGHFMAASPRIRGQTVMCGRWLSGGPADQLDQAQGDQQQYDQHDDEEHGGLAPEDEDQGGQGHRPDPQPPAVQVRPLPDRAGGDAPAFAVVPD
jgi:hypothetical protein